MNTQNIGPEQFESIVRDTLHDVGARTGSDAGLADRLLANTREGETKVVPLRRRPGAWMAPLIAAAAVVAVAVGLVLAAHRGGNGGTVQPGTQHPTPAPTTASPSYPTPPPTVAGFRPIDTSYLDARHGWSLGDAGRCGGGTGADCATLLRTTDGGRTWDTLPVPPNLTSTHDSASCGDNGTIAGPCVDHVVFASASAGYLWSFHTLYLTTDGGAHWTDTGTEYVVEVVTFGDTVARLIEQAGCSSGCSYGVQFADAGTDDWSEVVPFSAGGTLPWRLAGVPGTAYLVEQFPGADEGSVGPVQLYRSTDGRTWTRVTSNVPCGTRGIDDITVSTDGRLHATCL